eukprot:Gb_18317 [translate_table: standard]
MAFTATSEYLALFDFGWHLKAYLLAWPASDKSKNSKATRPSTDPTAYPSLLG